MITNTYIIQITVIINEYYTFVKNNGIQGVFKIDGQNLRRDRIKKKI